MAGGFPKRRVVLTGVGLVSPIGVGTRATWDALLAGQSGIGPITHFDAAAYPSRIAGEVKGFDPALFLEKKEIKKTDAFIQYALGATHFALEDAGFVIDNCYGEFDRTPFDASSANEQIWIAHKAA